MNFYSAKFMNEATASLSSKVFRKPVTETYLFSTMNILREMNTTINEATKQMYVQISEAESKDDENKIFANYFYQFRQIFQDFSNRVNEMKSRMIISVENKAETWEDLITDDQYISSFDKEFKYDGYKFSYMEDENYPRLNLMKIYQKEFDYIGQLMQDGNGIGASSSAKLKIIASVSNNFIKSSGNRDWIKNIVKEMIDEDDDDDLCKSYSECIYNSLKEKKEIEVDKGTLYKCKEKLTDYEDVVDAAVKLCDNLLSDLNKVAENISSYLFRNQDNKLKIKTDTDGVIDRDYRLDTYSMNQLDLFLKNKIGQIKKVLNVYAVAIGIKFDTVVDYINQNIDILNMAKNYSNTSDELSDDEESMEDDIDDANSDDVDMDDDEGKEPISEEEPEDDETTLDDETTPEDEGESFEGGENLEDDASEEFDFDAESGDFEESYLFESSLFEIEMMQENAFMHQEILEALMLEEENNTALTSVQKTAEKLSGWQAIVQRLANLWKKFKEVVFERSNTKIDYLKKNAKHIETTLTSTINFKYTPKINELENIRIPDLTTAVVEKITNEDSFINEYFGKFSGEGTISDRIKKTVLGEEQLNKPANGLTNVTINDAYNFCIDYPKKIAPIKRDLDIIEKAQRVAKDITKVEIGESANNNDYMQYFSEMDEVKDDSQTGANNTTTDQKNKDTSANNNKSKQVTIYFKVCSQVLAAEMTCYQKLFNEFYAYCNWWIKKVSGNSGKSDDGASKSANAASGEVKFD